VNIFFATILKPDYIDIDNPPAKQNWSLKACEAMKIWFHWPILSKMLKATVSFVDWERYNERKRERKREVFNFG
jgi:hypothetical protein